MKFDFNQGCRLRALLALVCFYPAVACDEYVEPPTVEIVAPPTGTFFVGDPLSLRFSLPVDPATLVVNIWPDERNLENELIAAQPALADCTVTAGSCGPNALTLHEDRLGATIEFDSETLGRPDVPLLLEVAPGLRADNGATRRYTQYFDFQFKPAEVDAEPVEFEEGGHIIVAILEQPLPAVINLIADFRVGPDNRVATLGAEGDPIAGAPENTGDPAELSVDTTAQGYVIFALATLRISESGTRFYESDPFDINLQFGGIRAVVGGTRLTGAISTDPDTSHQRIDGTMSFERFQIDVDGSDPYQYPPGSTTFVARWVAPEEMPEGSPSICGDMCGVVTAQCEPPADFPGEGFCDE